LTARLPRRLIALTATTRDGNHRGEMLDAKARQ
jgi:hypothetical protein